MPEQQRANIFCKDEIDILGDVAGNTHLEQLRCKN